MMNYEPLDSLPYIDEEITPEDHQVITELILKELEQVDLTVIHPQVEEIYTIPKQISSLKQNDESGVDLSKYNDLESDEILQISSSYMYLKQISLKLYKQYGTNQWIQNNDLIKRINEDLEVEVENKKRKITDLNNKRQSIQLELQPTLNHLNQRWTQGISKNVEIGVEILKLENGLE